MVDRATITLGIGPHSSDFCFLSTKQELFWEEHLRNDLFLYRVGCKTKQSSRAAIGANAETTTLVCWRVAEGIHIWRVSDVTRTTDVTRCTGS